MPSRREKILALQFKYFGDAVLLTPALRALRESYPEADIHLLAPAEIAPPAADRPRDPGGVYSRKHPSAGNRGCLPFPSGGPDRTRGTANDRVPASLPP